jgi:polyisoprenyl-phosphate glycosyltransferase
MKISIVVPCFNEEQVLNNFYTTISEVLHNEWYEYELVFVNDGSKDNTLKILKTLSSEDKKVRYASFSRNFGKESAMLAGLTYASGDAVIIMDADLQHPPSLIPELVSGFLEGFDQVIAKRTRAGESIKRTFVTKLYYKLMNQLIDVQLVDGIGDFRLLSRRTVDSLIKLKEYNRFSKGLFSWVGFKEKIINYENVVRNDGESKWTFSKLLNYGIDGVISFNNKPLRISIYLGMLTTFVAVLYVLYSFIKSVVFGVDVPGYFTIISAVLLLSGVQLMFLGIIGEYIGRIYYETKNRPHFIIQEDYNTDTSKEETLNQQWVLQKK